MILIIILLTLIIIFILQEKFIKNKKKYKNKYIKIYEEIKIPIFITCIVVIIQDLICNNSSKPELLLFMNQPKF